MRWRVDYYVSVCRCVLLIISNFFFYRWVFFDSFRSFGVVLIFLLIFILFLIILIDLVNFLNFEVDGMGILMEVFLLIWLIMIFVKLVV